MFGLGIWELLIVLIIVLVIFGAGKLPEIGSGLGRGIKNLKTSLKGEDEIDVTPKNQENTEKVKEEKKETT